MNLQGPQYNSSIDLTPLPLVIMNARQKKHCVFLVLIIGLFTVTTLSAQPLKPVFVPGVVSILQSHDYFRQHKAPVYWESSPYYISQRNDSSCSLATITMVVNAAKSSQAKYANQPLATQNSVLYRVKDKNWEKSTGLNGRGVTLDQIKPLMAKALKAWGMHNFTINVVHLNHNSQENAARLHRALLKNESQKQSFIIANFNHGVFTGSNKNEGHFAPVGAYDQQKKRVLIMDPYRKLYEPYWVPEKLFLKAMATIDHDSKRHRGYVFVNVNGQD